ncbi:hypothetical protein HDV04_004666 [Boothiomyces sp. JEL0838]|nr:hypothetical protein HDV04_004666 [Boothiomyces sp. JEL0838]
MEVGKFKSLGEGKVTGVSDNKAANEWKPPLRRHINPEGVVEFLTIRVRVLNGESEHDFHARFPNGPLYANTVCRAIAEKEQLRDTESKIFSLWVVSKDLGSLLLMVLKYTHFPEAENAQHHINHHWFIYRREASITIREEIAMAGDTAIKLLFGEAKRNTLTKRWVCTQLAASTVAGMQLQIAYGDYDEKRTPPGFLSDDIGRLEQLIPVGMSSKLRASQWEEIITVQYKTMMGLTIPEVRLKFLEFSRELPCYGCAVFPVCSELPPSGFFEYRTQNWFIGVGPNGINIMDHDNQKYIASVKWSEATWRTGTDQFYLTSFRNGKAKEFYLITPQTLMIENLCRKLKYKWAKEAGIIAPNKGGSALNLASKRYVPLEKVVVEETKGKRGSENLMASKKDGSRRGSENLLGKERFKGSMEQVSASIESLGKRSRTILKGSAEQLSGTVNKLSSILHQDDKLLQEIRRARNAGTPITASAEALDMIQDVKLPSSNTNLKSSQNLNDSKENIKQQAVPVREAKSVENILTSKENLQHQHHKLRSNENVSKPKDNKPKEHSKLANSATVNEPTPAAAQEDSNQKPLPENAVISLTPKSSANANPTSKFSNKPNEFQPTHGHKFSNKPDSFAASSQSNKPIDEAKSSDPESTSSSAKEQKSLFNNAKMQRPFRPSSSVQNNSSEVALLAQLSDLGSSLDQNAKLSVPDSLKTARGPVNNPKSRLTEADFELLAKKEESAKQKAKEAAVPQIQVDNSADTPGSDREDHKPKVSHDSSKHSVTNEEPPQHSRKQSIVNENIPQTYVKSKASVRKTMIGKISEAITQPMEVNRRVNDKFDLDQHLGGVGPTQLIDKRENK